MAIRYSGDVEVRMQWQGKGRLSIRVRGITDKGRLEYWKETRYVYLHPSANGYDRIATRAIRDAEADLRVQFRKEKVVRRGYQAPCPE